MVMFDFGHKTFSKANITDVVELITITVMAC